MASDVSLRALALRPLFMAIALIGAVIAYFLVRAGGDDALDAGFVALGVLGLGLVALWLLREGLHEALDHRALRSIDPGERRPGAWVAVAGRAVTREQTLEATLSGRAALACKYQVLERSRSATRGGPATGSQGHRSSALKLRYEGYHQSAIGIETKAGVVRVRALLDLLNLEKSGIGSPGSDLAGRAERRERFPPRYAARAHLAGRVSERFDVDWTYGDVEGTERGETKEWVLPPGEEVVVFGRWDGEALVPSVLRPRGLPVYTGSPEAVAHSLGGGSKIWLVLTLGAIVGAVALVLWNLR
jgi:hypothetical protein